MSRHDDLELVAVVGDGRDGGGRRDLAGAPAAAVLPRPDGVLQPDPACVPLGEAQSPAVEALQQLPEGREDPRRRRRVVVPDQDHPTVEGLAVRVVVQDVHLDDPSATHAEEDAPFQLAQEGPDRVDVLLLGVLVGGIGVGSIVVEHDRSSACVFSLGVVWIASVQPKRP